MNTKREILDRLIKEDLISLEELIILSQEDAADYYSQITPYYIDPIKTDTTINNLNTKKI